MFELEAMKGNLIVRGSIFVQAHSEVPAPSDQP